MLKTIEAIIDEQGHVTLNERVALLQPSKALVTILNDGRRTVELAPDVAAVFRTADEVNDALRMILRAAERISGRVAS